VPELQSVWSHRPNDRRVHKVFSVVHKP